MSKENYWKHLLRVEQEELQELRRQQEQQKLDDELEGHYQNNWDNRYPQNIRKIKRKESDLKWLN